VRRLKSREEWIYHISGAREGSPYRHDYKLIETLDRTPVAYLHHTIWNRSMVVREFAVRGGHPWRPVLAFVARQMKALCDELNESRDPTITWLLYYLGSGHKAYRALGDQVESPLPSYCWYVRVADIPGFLRHIAPVLERRLAASVMAGHTGCLRLNLCTQHLTLDFDGGGLKEIGTYEPSAVADGDALFPELTFLHLLFGHKSLSELADSRADCFARNPEAKILLEVLFPRRRSNPIELG
jgi:hypothetical protein